MKMYVGIDIVEISRFDEKILGDSKRLNICFTSQEQKYCLSSANPAEHFAGRFAAKEAITKALSGFGKSLAYSLIEILNDETGRPYVTLHSNDEFIKKIIIDVSISHSKKDVVAVSIAYFV